MCHLCVKHRDRVRVFHSMANIFTTSHKVVRSFIYQRNWVLLLLLPNVLEHRSLLVVFLLLPKSPRGPPWNEGHRPRVHHETSVFEVPAQEQHEHSFYSSSTYTFITGSLYMVRRYHTSPGAPDLQVRLG